MIIDLQGKKALVGGSSGGLGRSVALQLARSGASVTLMARNREKLADTLANLDISRNQDHQILQVDFSDFDGFTYALEDYFERNTVDILVNNTQGPTAGSALDKTVDDYQTAFDLLFKTIIKATELAIPGMRTKNWGRVINMTSVTVQEPLPHLALSNSIRAAVTTWAKSLASEIGPFGVTINNLLTGYFMTDRLRSLQTKTAEQRGISASQVLREAEGSIPMRRIGDPQEYGYLVAFLASDLAGYITGTNIAIDGGAMRSL